MRILSKYKDYYDSAQGYGIDTTLVYDRSESETQYVEIPGKPRVWDLPLDFTLYSSVTRKEWGVRPVVLGFCGQLYPILLVTKSYNTKDTVFFDYPTYAEWRKEFQTRYFYKETELAEFFQLYTKTTDEPFINYNAPIFAVTLESSYNPSYKAYRHSAVVRTNVILEKYHFYRIKDAFTAYQEISQYLGNVLTSRKEPLEIADKYKIEQHGFDKYSFRHPTKLKK